MKSKKLFFIIFTVMLWIILFSNKSFAGTQKWNNLDYNVKLNYDGSMDVVETWDVYVSETNTLFKDFDLDSSKYSGITNVSVAEISPDKKEFEQIYEEQYHVDSGCFYGLEVDSDTFEIAWNVGLDNSSDNRTYEIRYTVNDAVKLYNDCTELYWMFLSTENKVPAKKVTGTITLPASVSDIEKLRVWGHGPLNANIEKTSKDTVKFDCNNLEANTMLEIRVVTEENVYEDCTNNFNKNKLDSILEEEGKWADEANSKRRFSRIFVGIIMLILAIIIIYFVKKMLEIVRAGKELELKYKRTLQDLKYFRDIPNEKDATPARASYLFKLRKNKSNIDDIIPQIFSATILDLALKGYLEFEPIDKKNFNIIIKNSDLQKLSDDEKKFFSIILKASKNKNTLTTDELLKYTKKNYNSLHYVFESIKRIVESFQKSNNNIDSERINVCEQWKNKSDGYFVKSIIVFFISIFLMYVNSVLILIGFVVIIGIIILGILCYKNSTRVSILSDKGAEEQLQWLGLNNYMKDFSLLKEKEVPDLVLWEKFLVYATAFGISKEVIKQLKVVYPEMLDQNYYNNHNCSYMYYMCDSRFGEDFINRINNTMSSAIKTSQSAYVSAHSSDSSGSGGGGGFSGGGGGRRGPEVALEVDKKYFYVTLNLRPSMMVFFI